ncbi:MAG: hypothetical protein ACD_75C00476G0001 [uncultured bacterium]|nr:MAG: hypothetical protein ACD_75C00476G0001 [uncultured bacterium]
MECIFIGKVFELDHASGKDFLNGHDKFFNQLFVFFTAYPRVFQADIQGVVEQYFVVGADIDGNRQAERRMNPATGGVEGEFANRNPHAVGAQIAEAENTLAIGNDNYADILPMPVAKKIADAAFIFRGNVDTAGPAEDMSVLETCQTYRRGIDNWHQFFDIIDKNPIKKRFVAILQAGEKNVTLHIRGFLAKIPQYPLNLFIQAVDPGRQQPTQSECITLLFGKGGTLIECRIPDQGETGGETAQPALRLHFGEVFGCAFFK